jgi:hypothetical protein
MEGKLLKEEAYVEKGAVTLEGIGGEQIPLEQADLVIMNPPFTRQERLPKEYKSALMKRLKGYEDCLHGQLGLYGYFILLADKFTKENGRIALVLPATILRVKSAQGIRKLLTEKYQIEHIITAWERAAFSEGAQFREILLIAKKNQPSNKSKCCVTLLKNLPHSIEDAIKITENIRSLSERFNANEVYADDKMSSRIITQGELKRNLKNMYVLIATSDLKLVNMLEEISQKNPQKLISFSSFMKQNNCQMVRFDYDPPFHGTIIVQPIRAIKKVDGWTVKETKEKALIAQNRFTNEEISIPINVLARGLRRASRTDKINITNDLDYILISDFDNSRRIIKDVNILKEWKDYVRPRLANVLLSRRLDISAVGTREIAFYSSKPMVGAHMWSIKGTNEENARLLTLWLNSTPNLLSMLIYRTETRGAWMVIHSYAIGTYSVLNPEKLTEDERKILLNTFEKVQDVSFPSVLEQLRGRFWARVEIDKAILKVLGFNETETNQLLDYLYLALTKEIEQLKTLMQG